MIISPVRHGEAHDPQVALPRGAEKEEIRREGRQIVENVLAKRISRCSRRQGRRGGRCAERTRVNAVK